MKAIFNTPKDKVELKDLIPKSDDGFNFELEDLESMEPVQLENGDTINIDNSDPSSYQEGGNHYVDMVIHPTEYIERNNIGFTEGCIIKRASRHNHPTGGGLEDIKKIIHEAKLLAKYRYGVEL